ncbi:MAG: [FeFe] hydrogenase H-cluster radical SAM maturase HydE [Treponema sp.]|nr:[FeFe] hydrogenase H-cluster radical SAM maturase HydE [Treponema sp.]
MNDSEILHIIKTSDNDEIEALFTKARNAQEVYYGKSVYVRGLIEITNHCKNDCLYCGLRCSNSNLKRYRLSIDEILGCCRTGDKLGFKTFVLQGGEDPHFTAQRTAEVITAIRCEFPDHAITLSLGERPISDYELFYKTGANRYLLRHETANDSHYKKLHPPAQTLSARKKALYSLKEIGFQTGAGFMIESPFQTPENLLEDIRFLEDLQPQMIGIGPFLPQKDTPFGSFKAGSLLTSLKMIALSRILLPHALIPASTAIGTVSPNGRELALKAGANVVMPNLTPPHVKNLYIIYDNKAVLGDEAAENLTLIKEKITNTGYTADMSRGDALVKKD